MGIVNVGCPDGLTPECAKVFQAVSTLECIKGLFLCGGTAQSVQTGHRLSEDLDFELIGTRRERPQLQFERIINEISLKFPKVSTEILGDDHFHVFIGDDKVKLSFYRPENPVKCIHEGLRFNNVCAPSLQDLLGMKLYTICLRSTTRDFYDVYCLLKDGCSLSEGISYASYLSRHEFKSKNMLSKLLAPQLYPVNEDFLKLKPRYHVTSAEMQGYFLSVIPGEKVGQIRNKGKGSGKSPSL